MLRMDWWIAAGGVLAASAGYLLTSRIPSEENETEDAEHDW